jgi:dipeptidyl aminopeptidase/acylaminoacyl peptidase
VKEYWKEFSPMHNIEKGTPPTLIMIGTEDHLVPVATVQNYKKLMEENGNICELILYENEKHGFYNKTKFLETILETDKFLTSLGYLKERSLINKESSK